MGVKTVIVDGMVFISKDLLVDEMVKGCVAYTDTDDIEVSNEEANLVSAYQRLVKGIGLKSMEHDFHDKYVSERFVKRTLGV